MTGSWPASAALAVLLGGCASAPVHYYSLTPAAAAPSSTAVRAPCCTVELKSVNIPAEVDRPELVARYDDQQLDILGSDLWAAPLRDEIRGALLVRIRQSLADSPATDPPAPLNRRFVVMVEVQRFEATLAQRASIQAQWRVTSSDAPKSPALEFCEASSTVAIDDGVSNLVLGLQKAISVIGDRIAADIAELHRSGVSRCNNNQ